MRTKYYIEPLSGVKSDNAEDLKHLIKKPIHGDITFVIEDGDYAVECIKEEDIGLVHVNTKMPVKGASFENTRSMILDLIPTRIGVANMELKKLNLDGVDCEIINIILEVPRRAMLLIDFEELCERLLNAAMK